jgi:hypothetical protein
MTAKPCLHTGEIEALHERIHTLEARAEKVKAAWIEFTRAHYTRYHNSLAYLKAWDKLRRAIHRGQP